MSLESLRGKKVALGVCGGIAAYKAVEVARLLTQAGAEVQVVMTPSAVNFVGPLTFAVLTGNPVRIELFPRTVAAEIAHTDLARSSDLILVAPATAKCMAKLAQGMSDDLMSALLLAAKCQIIMAPAMHTEMWEDEATQRNASVLTARGVRIEGPERGALAGPDVGLGRLADPGEIVAAAAEEVDLRGRMEGVRILITAGGTREAIDPARFIGNASSGKMGYFLAHEALRRGAGVKLITGPTHLTPPASADVVQVTTASEMGAAVKSSIESVDALVMSAAVADWRPAHSSTTKLRKGSFTKLVLEPTVDILLEAGEQRIRGALPGLRVLAGFCAETDSLEANGTAKLMAKHLDFIIANQIGVPGSGFESDTTRAMLIRTNTAPEDLGLTSKRNLARLVMNAVAGILCPI